MKHPNELQSDLAAIGEAVARLTVIHVAKNTAARTSIILNDLESIIFLKLFERDEMELTFESHPLLKPQFLEDVIVRLYGHGKKSVTAKYCIELFQCHSAEGKAVKQRSH
jgi:hypothetical protein